MGSATTRLRNSLREGDEETAAKAWREQVSPTAGHSQSPDKLEKLEKLKLSLVLGDGDGNTALHYALLHAMPELLSMLLDHGCYDASLTNCQGRNCVHLLCDVERSRELRRTNTPHFLVFPQAQAASRVPASTGDAERATVLTLLAQKCGPSAAYTLCRGQDSMGATPLHVAAKHDLHLVAAELLGHGASVFALDGAGRTPCDVAASCQHHKLAVLLSARMVYSLGADGQQALDDTELLSLRTVSGCRALRVHEIVEEKDKLIVEAAVGLRMPLHVATVLLRQLSWNLQSLMLEWVRDPGGLLRQASLPDSFLDRSSAEHVLDLSAVAPAASGRDATAATSCAERECGICMSEMRSGDAPQAPCGHRFCTECWRQFLAGKIHAGESSGIPCPQTSCAAAVPVELVDHLMEAGMRRRYELFNVKAFVADVVSLQWCPVAGCDKALSVDVGADGFALADGAVAVDCGSGHLTCWRCQDAAHEPCTCAMVREWQRVVVEMRPAAAAATTDTAQERLDQQQLASKVWLVGNSKPCPKCQVAIERSTGCNHMTCRKCLHDFCWMCRDDWKLHSKATGGYFKCTRKEAEEYQADQASALSTAKEVNSAALKRTMFTERYEEAHVHGEHFKKHAALLAAVDRNMADVISAVAANATCGESMEHHFLTPVVLELMCARATLRWSCVRSYFLARDTPERHGGQPSLKLTIYCGLQAALRTAVDELTAMVSARYVQTPRAAVVRQALLVRGRRTELVQTVLNGILPDGVEEEQARAEEQQSREQERRRGTDLRRHRDHLMRHLFRTGNFEEDDDDDDDADADADGLMTTNAEGVCERAGCTQPRTLHTSRFCSRMCLRLDRRRRTVGRTATTFPFEEDDVDSNRVMSNAEGVCERAGCTQPHAHTGRFCSRMCLRLGRRQRLTQSADPFAAPPRPLHRIPPLRTSLRRPTPPELPPPPPRPPHQHLDPSRQAGAQHGVSMTELRNRRDAWMRSSRVERRQTREPSAGAADPWAPVVLQSADPSSRAAVSPELMDPQLWTSPANTGAAELAFQARVDLWRQEVEPMDHTEAMDSTRDSVPVQEHREDRRQCIRARLRHSLMSRAEATRERSTQPSSAVASDASSAGVPDLTLNAVHLPSASTPLLYSCMPPPPPYRSQAAGEATPSTPAAHAAGGGSRLFWEVPVAQHLVAAVHEGGEAARETAVPNVPADRPPVQAAALRQFFASWLAQHPTHPQGRDVARVQGSHGDDDFQMAQISDDDDDEDMRMALALSLGAEIHQPSSPADVALVTDV